MLDSTLEELEGQFRQAYPDVPFRRALLRLVGGVPDDGRSLAQVMLEYYESESEELIALRRGLKRKATKGSER